MTYEERKRLSKEVANLNAAREAAERAGRLGKEDPTQRLAEIQSEHDRLSQELDGLTGERWEISGEDTTNTMPDRVDGVVPVDNWEISGPESPVVSDFPDESNDIEFGDPLVADVDLSDAQWAGGERDQAPDDIRGGEGVVELAYEYHTRLADVLVRMQDILLNGIADLEAISNRFQRMR